MVCIPMIHRLWLASAASWRAIRLLHLLFHESQKIITKNRNSIMWPAFEARAKLPRILLWPCYYDDDDIFDRRKIKMMKLLEWAGTGAGANTHIYE